MWEVMVSLWKVPIFTSKAQLSSSAENLNAFYSFFSFLKPQDQ
jgi:hypothetical protein